MKNILFLICLASCSLIYSQQSFTVASPDKQIRFSIVPGKSSPLYNVSFKGKPVIENSPLSLAFDSLGSFKSDLRVTSVSTRKGNENYELITGKARLINDHFNEIVLSLKQTKTPFLQVNLVVRVFDSGLGFRYEFPSQANFQSLKISDENSSFKFASDPKILALLLPNYTTSHEGEYSSLHLSELTADTLIDMPAVFELPGGTFASITEAALVNYAGMYLSKHDGLLVSRLSPLPRQRSIKVEALLPFKSPWRVILLSNNPGGLIESNVITSLNEPLKLKDLGWIQPGKTTFPWWNGNVLPDTINAPGNNFITNKYYIDFCARNAIEYHSVVEYGLHQWYVDDGVGFAPGPHSDPTTPVPGLDMKEICDYAKSKGVGVRVWVHWAALYPKLDSAFAKYEQWGLSGMMVDFMDRDDQDMVNMQEEILRKAAQHKLHIQFHGAYKPTGMNRTYPNEFTREGTLNYEVNKWAKRITPDHDLNIAFVRTIAGATDYHLGGFRAVPDSLFKVQYTRPVMLGTRSHMLAMYVVLESYLGMVCDYPAAYEGEPGFEFIKDVPTTWDETKVIKGELNKYILIARRKGSDWYIGSINNHDARVINFNLDFLSSGQFKATIIKDGDNVDTDPNRVTIEDHDVTSADSLSISMAPGGGFAVKLISKK